MATKFLLDIALIIAFVKIFGLITRKFNMPSVIGGLLAGIFLGPAIFGLVQSNEMLDMLSELGIIILLFVAGLETDFPKFKQNAKHFLVIATMGVLFPLVMGFGASYLFIGNFAVSLFAGIVLTATSVSITIEALSEMKQLHTKQALAILGAGVVDDIIGIIFLTLALNQIGDSSESIYSILFKIAFFLVISIVLGYAMYRFFEFFERIRGQKRRIAIFGLVFCLVLAYIAETLSVSSITGAYIAGLVLGNTKDGRYIKDRMEILGYMLFTPIFFASIGLKITSFNISASMWIFSVLLILIAASSKVIGAGIGSKICRYTNKESLQIGVGMIARGEVALIMIDKGREVGILGEELFVVLVVVTVFTTVIAPVLLKFSFTDRKLAL